MTRGARTNVLGRTPARICLGSVLALLAVGAFLLLARSTGQWQVGHGPGAGRPAGLPSDPPDALGAAAGSVEDSRAPGGTADPPAVGAARAPGASPASRASPAAASPATTSPATTSPATTPRSVVGFSDVPSAQRPRAVLGTALVDDPRAYFPAGRVIDATTGWGVDGARVLALAFRGPAATAAPPSWELPRGSELTGSEAALSAAARPALHAEEATAAADGGFFLSAVLPDDPRLWLHLEVSHPGYAPGSADVPPRQSDGRRDEVEIELRRATTVRLEFIDPEGRPLRWVPVRVGIRRDGHDFLESRDTMSGAGGRLVAASEPRIVHTDGGGVVLVEYAPDPLDLELLYPELHLFRRGATAETIGRISVILPRDGSGLRLSSRKNWVERHVLVDAAGLPIRDADVECELEGMPRLRLRTDESGGFLLGGWPRIGPGVALSRAEPRPGVLRLLDPAFPAREARVSFPDAETLVEIAVEPWPLLRLRTVAVAEPGLAATAPTATAPTATAPTATAPTATAPTATGVVPVPADGVETSLDMTLVRRRLDGVVEYRGVLPAAGTSVRVAVRGCLPAAAVVPSHARSRGFVDLGDVVLDRGWSRGVVVVGADPATLRAATVILVAQTGDPHAHRYPLDGASHVSAGGLRTGSYLVALERPGRDPAIARMEVREETLCDPFLLVAESASQEDVVLGGRIVDLLPLEHLDVMVVEAYGVAGSARPLTFPAYPLSPDGVFGSRRRLAGVTAVEVAVVSRGTQGARASARRLVGALPSFAVGDLRLRPLPRAEIDFVVDGLGRVSPPLRVALRGRQGLEALSRIALRGRRLVVDAVRPGGNYTLLWRGALDEEESFAFHVPRELVGELELVAPRRPAAEELIEVLVTDATGRPIDAARIEPGPTPGCPLPGEPGVRLARIRAQSSNAFEVSAPGYLIARVAVEAGAAIPTEVPLLRGATVQAEILDPLGRRVHGALAISWEPPRGSRAERGVSVRHGEERVVAVDRGWVRDRDLPSIPLCYTLRLVGSSAMLRREWTLPEGDGPVDLGTLRLEETRAIRGNVILPGGAPASGATVAIVPPEEAYRLPLGIGGVARGLWSASTDALGAFAIEVSQADLSRPLALVAHLSGFSDAVEDPLDLAVPGRTMALQPESSLALDVGYSDGVFRASHGFWLDRLGSVGRPAGRRNPDREDRDRGDIGPGDIDRGDIGRRRLDRWGPDRSGPDRWGSAADPSAVTVLGEIGPDLAGGHRFPGVEPGIYQVRWGLREPYAPLPGLFQRVEVVPGWESRLVLRLEGRTLRGSARLNGESLRRGWVLLTDDPGPNGATVVGRVEDGEFTVIDPPRSVRALAALIPEGTPQPLQNTERGEALPVPLENYRGALRRGRLDVDVRAHDLTLELGMDFLARHPGAAFERPSYSWDGQGFRSTYGQEPIESRRIVLRLLAPGPHRIGIRSFRGSLLYQRVVFLREDETVPIGGR